MQVADVLVPVDFSTNSQRAIAFAAELVAENGELCLMHVIDLEFVARLAQEGFAESEAAIERLRLQAEQHLQELRAALTNTAAQIETMVVVGRPFAEILRIANDLQYSWIILGTQGRRGADIEEMLFGSTAEKVIRASRVPVIVVPSTWSSVTDKTI